MKKAWSVFWAVLIFLCVAAAASAQKADDLRAYHQAKPQDMKWFQDAKLGMFVHWGPVSLSGCEIGFGRYGAHNDGSWSYPLGPGSAIPPEEYDNLYKKFNPTNFNAEEFVGVAKSMGAKYIVFVTKHCDDFAMFDSKVSDYTISSTPYKKDIVKQVADAAHRQGLKLGFYYTQLNWKDPDYFTANHARYLKKMTVQLREICTNYGKVSIIWFDGFSFGPETWDAENLFKMIRTLQPGVLINNRCGLPGDYDTPEQWIGTYQDNRAWESCLTLGTQWSWRPNDTIKSATECIQDLVQCAGGNGNLLLNVGPMPDGRIESRQLAVLRTIGEWTQKYGQTIFGTRGGPWIMRNFGVSTRKGNTIYVHILKWESDTIDLGPLPCRIVSARALTGGKALVRQSEDGIEVSMPKEQRDAVDTIIEMKLDGSAMTIQPMRGTGRSLTTGKKVTTSNVFQNQDAYSPRFAVDDDFSTRWATDAGTTNGWLEVDFVKPETFSKAFISEGWDRTRRFELQYRNTDTEAWKTCVSGTKIGIGLKAAFPPVTARYVRLHILESTDGPTIWEFQVYR